jgi:hypothetical protein
METGEKLLKRLESVNEHFTESLINMGFNKITYRDTSGDCFWFLQAVFATVLPEHPSHRMCGMSIFRFSRIAHKAAWVT